MFKIWIFLTLYNVDVPCIPGAYATRNFAYLARGPWRLIVGTETHFTSAFPSFHHNPYLTEISFHYNPIPSYDVATILTTCHDNKAVMTNAKYKEIGSVEFGWKQNETYIGFE